VRLCLVSECTSVFVEQKITSEELLRESKRLADKHGLKVTSHISGGTLSFDKSYLQILRRTGRTDTHMLMQMGILDSSWILVHGINCTATDLRLMADAGWKLLTAESATEAKRLVQEHKPNAALLDYMLPDGNGVELGVEFLQAVPGMLVIVMTGTILPTEEEALCEEHNFPVLRKPFLASEVMGQIRGRLIPASGVTRA